MNSKSTFKALAGAFSTGWMTLKSAGPPAVYEAKTPIAWPNVNFTPPSGPWVRFNVLDGEGAWRSIGSPGSNIAGYVGVVVIQVFTPLMTGESTARDYADAAAAIFQGQVISGIRFSPATAQILNTSLADGWHQINVSIPFRRDVLI
jgi:hypothetical protein